MTVALPTGKVKNATVNFHDWGGILSSVFAGVDQRLNRLGSRYSVNIELAPMRGEDAAIWISRLTRGMREKASIKFPQPGIVIPTASTTVAVATASSAETINLGAGTYKEGTFFSLLHGGKRYVYQITANGSGGVNTIQPALRTSTTVGDVVSFNPATIEGFVSGDQRSWNIDDAKVYGLAFTITEAE